MISRMFLQNLLSVIMTVCFFATNGQETPSSFNGEQNPALLTTEKKEVIFDSLIQVSHSFLSINPDSSRLMALKASDYLPEGDAQRHIRLLNLMGITYFIQTEHSKALEKYLQGLTLAMAHDDSLRIADIYNNVGIVNMRTGNYVEALDNFLKAREYYEKINDVRNMSSTSNNVGLLYADIENFDMAREQYRIANKGFIEAGDSVGLAATLSNKGSLFLKMEKPDSAFYYFYKAIDVEKRTNNRFGLSATLSETAKVYSYILDYERALEYYITSIEMARQIQYPFKQCRAQQGLAQTYLKMGESSKALKSAHEAMNIAHELGNDKLRQETHEVFSLIYEYMGDFEKSMTHFRTAVEMKEEIVNQTKLHQIYNLEIQQLSQAKEIQQLEIQRQELMLSRKNNTIVFIIVGFLMIFSGLYLLYHNHRYRQLAAHQKAILDLTEKKSRAAVEAEIQERKRIGQELHDGLGQMLSVARLNISVLQQKDAITPMRKNELLEAAIYSVDKAFYELRDISHNLAPSALSEKGLIMALKELSEQVNKSKQMLMHLETYGINEPMDNLLENTLYRAIQELLNNAIKHARASEFFIQLVKNEMEITIIVEDNGQGFDASKTLYLPGGGLSNIRSRIENLNGSIYIDAMLNRGTIVTIVIPLKKVKLTKKSLLG